MSVDLQKADVWKRLAAWLLDFMLVCMLAVGVGALLSYAMDYGGKMERYEKRYDEYIVEYQLQDVDVANPASEEEQSRVDAASEAMVADGSLLKLRDQLQNLMLLIVTFSLLVTLVILEFLIPLWLKNGQTIGKKVFNLGVIRVDGVQVGSFQLFARTVLGKFTIETMVPVYALFLAFTGGMVLAGLILVVGLLIAQFICLVTTKPTCALHDQMSATVVVDISSQRVFKSAEELIEYTKRIHAEEVNRKEY